MLQLARIIPRMYINPYKLLTNKTYDTTINQVYKLINIFFSVIDLPGRYKVYNLVTCYSYPPPKVFQCLYVMCTRIGNIRRNG